MAPVLPLFAPFPDPELRPFLQLPDWQELFSAWISLAKAHLDLDDAEFLARSTTEESLLSFCRLVAADAASERLKVIGVHQALTNSLLSVCLQLIARVTRIRNPPPSEFIDAVFLEDVAKVYGRKRTTVALGQLLEGPSPAVQPALLLLHKQLTQKLEAATTGKYGDLESRLTRVNFLIDTFPGVATLFLTGTDLLDGLVTSFRKASPTLRKAIIICSYLCFVGLARDPAANLSLLSDQLYALNTAAVSHRAGPLSVDSSLVSELVSSTPLLAQLRRMIEGAGELVDRLTLRLTTLEAFRRPGVASEMFQKRVRKRFIKGKGILLDPPDVGMELRVQRMSRISQIQEVFPLLGTAFVAKLLDEYDDDTEQVTLHLLESSLPPHLASADQSEEFVDVDTHDEEQTAFISTRRNIFDGDAFDRLAVDTSSLTFGKGTAMDNIETLDDGHRTPMKASILAALTAFDSDDDERDDSYDLIDVGGVTGTTHDGDADGLKEATEELLYRTYQANLAVFERSENARRGLQRARLRDETGMTSEAIEGWAIILQRTPQILRRLEAKYGVGQNVQSIIPSTAWRARLGSPDSGEDEGDDAGVRSAPPPVSRGHSSRGRRGASASNLSEQERRRRKEAQKGSGANHDRRNRRARKTGVGGLVG